MNKLFREIFGKLGKSNKICNNSNEVNKGDLFFAYPGEKTDGRLFIEEALTRGAKKIIYESSDKKYLPDKKNNKNLLPFKNLRDNIPEIVNYFFKPRIKSINLIGVTGTNGKSTSVYWLTDLKNKLGEKSEMIGTLPFFNKKYKKFESNLTTPDNFKLNLLLSIFKKDKIKSINMEVSSHAIDQKRIFGLNFRFGIFTNLTRDHLDYHKTMSNYFNAKKNFFLDSVEISIINIDDQYGKILFEELKNRNKDVLSYGKSKKADFRIIYRNKEPKDKNYVDFIILYRNESFEFRTKILGDFNIYNLTAVIAALNLEGYSFDKISTLVRNIKTPPGRLEEIITKDKRVYIDYAHTPDALKNVLKVLKDHYKKKITLIFGCGGNRDSGKRRLMAFAAQKYASEIYITSDNPRDEDPKKIIDEIAKYISVRKFKIDDRRLAIQKALKESKNEILLIAGKGHENYQIIKGTKYKFSDKNIVKNFKRNYEN